jgi:nicotinate-nucleotide--dimethylbenzimidazole phosphoribosyltransferase
MQTLQEQLQQIINNKTKPLGALGRLEEIALTVGLIQETTQPAILNPYIIVFAADHGITATGLVNPYPQAVTAQMVLNFLHGGAAINVFCRQHNIGLKVVDAGVNFQFEEDNNQLEFIQAKIALGTKNYLHEAAMTKEEAITAMNKGKSIVSHLANDGCNCIGFGEMGIGNTSSASLIMSSITGIDIAECTGKGTGATGEQLQTKTATLQQVYKLHELDTLSDDPLELLSVIGGFEIAMMAGAYLQASNEKMVIVVDGFIATAALLIAQKINEDVLNYCVFAHTSGERGHEQMLNYLQVQPLLNLGMRLGEGTGAALAIPLIESAVLFLNEMASFESAGVSNKS